MTISIRFVALAFAAACGANGPPSSTPSNGAPASASPSAPSRPVPTASAAASTDCTDDNLASWSNQTFTTNEELLARLAATPWADCADASKKLSALAGDATRGETAFEAIADVASKDRACLRKLRDTWAGDPRLPDLITKLDAAWKQFEDWGARCEAQPNYYEAVAVVSTIKGLMNIHGEGY